MRPETVEQLSEIIGAAAASGGRLELRGGGTRATVGAPREAEVVDMTGLAGILDYDPGELVLTAKAGTSLAEIEAAVAERGQMLAFEPWGAPGSTIGGVIAAGISGSRRLSRGGVRDHLLGFKAVSGRGEPFLAGAKVVKNVTGFDLPKVMAGSWGRLAALTEVSLKVLPAPAETLSLSAEGLDAGAAVALMARAMGSKADVAAAAGDTSRTVLRLEGFGPSVAARRALLEDMAPLRALGREEARSFWAGVREPLADAPTLWRVNVPPSRAPEVLDALPGDWTMDWAGGLIWLAASNDRTVRRAAEAAGGHATLWRAPETMRGEVPALHPQPAGVAALETRVRSAFDPQGVFETGRF